MPTGNAGNTKHSSSSVVVRRAKNEDLDALVELENRSFSYDQIGRRSFRYLTQQSTATIWCADVSQEVAQEITQGVASNGVTPCSTKSSSTNSSGAKNIAGYAIVLSRKNSRKWRIYSLATAPEMRGKGIAKALMHTILSAAYADTSIQSISLEVKCDNASAIALYRQLGFEVIDVLAAYYSDGTDGYRLQHSW